MTKKSDRKDYTIETRMGLAETDLEDHEKDLEASENRMAAANEDLRRTVQTEIAELRKNVVGVQRVLVGILVSLATASVLLAVNIGIANK